MFSKFFRIFAPIFFKRMVKQRIIDEALELFGRSGVKSITMDDLARHLGISKRTIYENFKNKEELLTACIDSFNDKSRAFVKDALLGAQNVAEAILMMLRKDAEQASQRKFNIIEDIRKYYPQVYKERLIRFHADKRRDFEHMIRRGIEEGVFRKNLNPEIIVHFFSGQLDNFTHDDMVLSKYSLSDIFENLMMTVLRGICTAKGLEIIDRYNEK